MKRIICGVGFFLVLLFFSAGFLLSYQVTELKERILSLEQASAQAEQKVSALGDARERDFVFERYEDGAWIQEAYRITAYGDQRIVLRQEKEQEQQEKSYLLKAQEGKVVVYEENGQEVYEYTDIPLEALPSQLQAEVLLGKKIENPEKLYNFLENYSS